MKSTSVAPLKGIRREPARCNWRAWCTGLAALALLPLTVSAQTITSAVPGAISYQGKVSNAAGALVGAGTPVNRTIVFRIWSHQSNSTVSDLVYSEQQTVTISEGEFSVLIGSGGAVSGTPLGYNESAKGPPSTTVASAAVFGGASRYLGVTIDDPSTSADPEVSPRQQLVTSAFAFRAKYAETVGSNGVNTLTALDNGNVGIGTGNPGTRLEVAGNIRAGGAGLPTTSLSLLANHATNLASSIGYSNSIGTYSTDAAAGDTVMRTENGGKLLLQTGTGSSAVVIDASNKVGMGTAAPSAKLEVMSSDALNTLFVSNTGGGGGTQPALRVKMAATSGARNVIQAENNSGTIFVVKDTGYVGIANTSPSALLHIGTGANAGPGGLVVNTGWINTADPTEHRPLDVQVRNNSALVVNSNGKVGIGSAAPSAFLFVQSPTTGAGENTATFRFGTAGGSIQSHIHYGATGDVYWRSGATNGKVILQDTGGSVGIGTSDPSQAKFVVSGVAGTDPIGLHYAYVYNGSGPSANQAYYMTDVGIKATHAIHALHFRAISDARIKNIQGRSDGRADLATLGRVEVSDYFYKDVIQKGSRPHKKVIAQQVEKVFPQAVTKTTDVVPDIYQKATAKDGWVELATNLKKGERVRLIGDKNEGVYEVLEVKADRFRTAFKPADEKIFVYGREVNDFLVVDYEAIAMLNVSATQELKRQNDALIKRVADLEMKDRARDAKLAAIEKLLQSSQTVMARPAATNASGQE